MFYTIFKTNKKFYIFSRLQCGPLVARHRSQWSSTSCHALACRSGVMIAMQANIRCLRWSAFKIFLCIHEVLYMYLEEQVQVSLTYSLKAKESYPLSLTVVGLLSAADADRTCPSTFTLQSCPGVPARILCLCWVT